MALFQKTNSSPRWPAVASTAALPNVLGSPTQSSALEAGDTCWVTGGGLYICTTATLGAAVWSFVSRENLLGNLTVSDRLGWRDYTTEITARSTGVGSPAFTVFRNGIRAYEFPHTSNHEFWMTFHIQHDWARGTPLFLHVHYAPGDTAISGDIRWGMEYTIAAGHQQGASSVFGATNTVYATQTIGANSNYEHHIAELSTGINDAKTQVDALVLVRFFRDVTVPNNFAASVWGFTADIHYQYDRYGTANRAPDFYGGYP